MAKLEIQYRKTADLIPYAKNARTHNEAHVSQIAASIKHWGWTNPILIDGENGVIAGHGRLLTGRHCYGLEIAPNYCDVIIQRWQNFTGKEATLDGKTYAQLAAERKSA